MPAARPALYLQCQFYQVPDCSVDAVASQRRSLLPYGSIFMKYLISLLDMLSGVYMLYTQRHGGTACGRHAVGHRTPGGFHLHIAKCAS